MTLTDDIMPIIDGVVTSQSEKENWTCLKAIVHMKKMIQNFENLSVEQLNGYVTPQLYGAVADGETDCTEAIQNAVDSGKYVVFPEGRYRMEGTVTLYNKDRFIFDASAANIEYTGTSYAFEIIHCQNCNLKFGSIMTTTGGCIHFSCNRQSINPNFTGIISNSWSQFINISFLLMGCSEEEVYDTSDPDNPVYLYNKYACIKGIQSGTDYANEIRINDGRFQRGQAIYLIQTYTQSGNITYGKFNHWKLFNVAFEGYVSNNVNHKVKGFRLDASSANTVKSGYSFVNCRNEQDNVDYIVDFVSDGYDCKVNGIYIYGPLAVGHTQFKFTSQTIGDIIAQYKPTTSEYGYTECCIVNGHIVPCNFSSRFATSSTIDHSDKEAYALNRYIYVNNAACTSLILPDYYFVRKGGINDFYIKFQHAKTNFDISVKRAGVTTLYGTIPSVSVGDVVHVVWFGNSLNSEETTLLLFTKEVPIT